MGAYMLACVSFLALTIVAMYWSFVYFIISRNL